jgi:protein-tyrosine phosphatase
VGRKPPGLIDVHCHILPALDDGALDLADSLAMARQAAGDGITVVCATPHIRDDHDVRVQELPGRIAALEAEIAAAAIPVEIALGGEVAQHAAQGLTAEQLRAVSLRGAGAVLIEPAPGPLGGGLLELAGRLRGEGVQVLIAHPERHVGEDFQTRLRELVDAGCLIQWTAAFLTGEHGEVALRFAEDGLLHLLGSDAHSSSHGRPVQIAPAIARLREACPPAQVDWIAHEAPWALLRGQPATPPF